MSAEGGRELHTNAQPVDKSQPSIRCSEKLIVRLVHLQLTWEDNLYMTSIPPLLPSAFYFLAVPSHVLGTCLTDTSLALA